ncbi:CpsD/CapB family tyrosine-protein kinase [Oceanobacter mangrovi]|uniref:CpsD/CapB family tyrosine-protein kinase n=1 Tax=Oceanobacter mangrovi TaxID=2862510 RepID=UPI001C8EBE08|nr:CpsD/CapB family tyrosine-protein kinase [Oceanobacter mangrovi]
MSDAPSSRAYAEQFRQLRNGSGATVAPPIDNGLSYSDRYRLHANRPGRDVQSQPTPAAEIPVAAAFVPPQAAVVQPEITAPTSAAVEEPQPPKQQNPSKEAKPFLKKLVARGQMLGFSSKVERQLTRSLRELGMIEGNLSSAGKDLKTLYFTSCFDGDGKSISALYAAYGLASHGEKVLLIDSNVNNPGLQRYFAAQGPGLADIITGHVPVEMVLHPTRYKSLEYIPAGRLPVGAHISNRAMKELLELLKPYYRYIVVDGSSVFSSSEATRMASAFDGMVMVVSCEQTRWEVAQSAEEKITNSGGKLVGISMNRRKFYIPRRIYDWLSG